MRKSLIAFTCVTTLLVLSLAFVSAGQFDKLTQIREDLKQVKGELGMYTCCIEPSCGFCALATGMCPCGDRVKNGDGVCGECLLGWTAGQGSIAGINAEDVTPMEGRMLDMMYRQRAATGNDDAAAGLHTQDAATHVSH